MTEVGQRLLAGAAEVLAIARGEIPAARMHIRGHSYIPEVERIVAVGIMHHGIICSLPPPARHGAVLRLLATISDEVIGPNEQGFVTSSGRWVDRETAGEIAIAAGQVTELQSPPWLFSEDLW